MRVETDEAFDRVPEVYEERRKKFKEVFGRDVGGFFTEFETEDAEIILIASGTVATTARRVVQERLATNRRALSELTAQRPELADCAASLAQFDTVVKGVVAVLQRIRFELCRIRVHDPDRTGVSLPRQLDELMGFFVQSSSVEGEYLDIQLQFRKQIEYHHVLRPEARRERRRVVDRHDFLQMG